MSSLLPDLKRRCWQQTVLSSNRNMVDIGRNGPARIVIISEVLFGKHVISVRHHKKIHETWFAIFVYFFMVNIPYG